MSSRSKIPSNHWDLEKSHFSLDPFGAQNSEILRHFGSRKANTILAWRSQRKEGDLGKANTRFLQSKLQSEDKARILAANFTWLNR